MPDKEELVAGLQKLIDAHAYDTIKLRNKTGASRLWWIAYLAEERKSLAIQYKILTGKDLDPAPEEKPNTQGGGGGGKEHAHV